MNDKVSVIIPTYNDSDVLMNAIDSVLKQTYHNLELIIVDDGSTDDTFEKVNLIVDERLRYIKHKKNKNASAARNTGIKNSSGDYIAFLDADDEWLPMKLEEQISLLNKRGKNWGGVYCNTMLVREKSKVDFSFPVGIRLPKEGGEELTISILLRTVTHCGSTLLLRREEVKKINGFDESFQRHQEVEFLIRLFKNTKIAYLDEPLAVINKSDYSISADVIKETRIKFLRKFKKEICHFEEQGYPIHTFHYLSVSKNYYYESRFQDGGEYLLKGLSKLRWSKNIIIILRMFILTIKNIFVGVKRLFSD